MITLLPPDAQNAIKTMSSDDDNDYEHWWCCDPDIALCGADISKDESWDEDEIDTLENPCPKCEEIKSFRLPCGTEWCVWR